VIEPNRLSAPGELGARQRVEEVFARLDELGPVVGQVPVPRLDLEEREVLLNDLEQLADRTGRGALLDEARDAVRDALLEREAVRWPAGTYGLDVRGTSTVEDRIEVISAVEDAVSVAVMEDLLDPETATALGEPGRRMLGLPALGPAVPAWPAPAAPATDGTQEPVADALTDPEDVADAAAAGTPWADADADLEADQSVDGMRGRRAAVFVILAAIAIPAVLAGGFVGGELVLGVVVVAAIGMLVWMLA
jgi:hypothetical protein